MGCCIIGAIVFGFIFGLWRRIGALFGVDVEKSRGRNPALWRLGDSSEGRPGTPAGTSSGTSSKVPLIAPRFAAAVAGGALSIVLGFWVVEHASHIRQEVTCGLHQAGLSLGDSALLCTAAVDHHDGHGAHH